MRLGRSDSSDCGFSKQVKKDNGTQFVMPSLNLKIWKCRRVELIVLPHMSEDGSNSYPLCLGAKVITICQ